jgi:hypothetical protein
VEVWGREGMRKLWSASNIKVYGGGVAEAEFLNEVAQLVGEYRYSNMTKSRSRQGISYNYDNDRKERTLDVSDLASFPRGHAIMFASGAPQRCSKQCLGWAASTTPKSGPPSPPTTPPSVQQRFTASGTVNPWVTAAASNRGAADE